MKWIFENFQIVVALLAALVYYLTRAKRTGDEEEREMPLPPGDVERGQAERTRRIQDEIRRKIAERRTAAGELATGEAPAEPPPPLATPPRVPPVDTFGGPMRRMVRELEEAVERRREATIDVDEQARAAELERQAHLTDQLRRMQTLRNAEEARTEAAKAAAATLRRVYEPGPAAGVSRLYPQLRDRDELRRAVVLREILGPPVSLR